MRRAEDAVTPVLGTVLILSITLLTIGTVLIAANPVIDRARDHASLARMVPELANVRQPLLEMSATDATRIVPVAVTGGDLLLAEGGRLVVSYALDGGCSDVRLGAGWNDAPLYTVAVGHVCGNVPTAAFTVCAVDGAVVDCTPPLTAAPPRVGTAHQTYYVRATDATCPAPGNVCGEAWIFSTARLLWSDAGGGDSVRTDLESGAVLTHLRSRSAAKFPFVDEGGLPADTPASSPGLVLRIPTLDVAGPASAPAGRRDVELRLTDLQVRASTDVTAVRIEASGPNARALCEALLLRNAFAVTGADTYHELYATYTGSYGTFTSGPCRGQPPLEAEEVFSVLYEPDAPASTDTFPFELTHAAFDVRLLF